MNKFYEQIFFIILFLIVLYNLVNYDILEGKKRRRRKKKRINMFIPKIKNFKKNMAHKISNNKDIQQDNEISILNNKINNINTNLINTQRITNEKIPSLINHINSQSDIKLNKIQEQISNNNLKNQLLKQFSEKKGRELQGNIDLLSSDLANNNIKYSDQIADVKNKLNTLQNKISIYEKNNSNIEKMLKNVNLQLNTKYVNK